MTYAFLLLIRTLGMLIPLLGTSRGASEGRPEPSPEPQRSRLRGYTARELKPSRLAVVDRCGGSRPSADSSRSAPCPLLHSYPFSSGGSRPFTGSKPGGSMVEEATETVVDFMGGFYRTNDPFAHAPRRPVRPPYSGLRSIIGGWSGTYWFAHGVIGSFLVACELPTTAASALPPEATIPNPLLHYDPRLLALICRSPRVSHTRFSAESSPGAGSPLIVRQTRTHAPEWGIGGRMMNENRRSLCLSNRREPQQGGHPSERMLRRTKPHGEGSPESGHLRRGYFLFWLSAGVGSAERLVDQKKPSARGYSADVPPQAAPGVAPSRHDRQTCRQHTKSFPCRTRPVGGEMVVRRVVGFRDLAFRPKRRLGSSAVSRSLEFREQCGSNFPFHGHENHHEWGLVHVLRVPACYARNADELLFAFPASLGQAGTHEWMDLIRDNLLHFLRSELHLPVGALASITGVYAGRTVALGGIVMRGVASHRLSRKLERRRSACHRRRVVVPTLTRRTPQAQCRYTPLFPPLCSALSSGFPGSTCLLFGPRLPFFPGYTIRRDSQAFPSACLDGPNYFPNGDKSPQDPRAGCSSKRVLEDQKNHEHSIFIQDQPQPARSQTKTHSKRNSGLLRREAHVPGTPGGRLIPACFEDDPDDHTHAVPGPGVPGECGGKFASSDRHWARQSVLPTGPSVVRRGRQIQRAIWLVLAPTDNIFHRLIGRGLLVRRVRSDRYFGGVWSGERRQKDALDDGRRSFSSRLPKKQNLRPTQVGRLTNLLDACMVSWFTGLGIGVIGYYGLCDNFPQVRRMVDHHIRRSGLASLARKHRLLPPTTPIQLTPPAGSARTREAGPPLPTTGLFPTSTELRELIVDLWLL